MTALDCGFNRRAQRCRSRLALTLAEREETSRSVAAGQSIRSIAKLLGRAPSTVSREIKRNGGQECYRASQADQAAWNRASRPKSCKLVANRALAYIVAGKLRLQWSPEQIAGWLKRTYSNDGPFQVSHETIYRSLFIQARGALKKELVQHLRRTRAMRRSRHHTQKTENHGRITDTVSIRERPAAVEDRAVPGHWEGDLLFGNNNSQIATLVERQTRYAMLAKVARKDTETVINALIKHARRLPQELYKTLTWDRGKEMADHERFTLATDVRVYFCDPQNPWQRGTNENTNGLLRQYLPKGTDLSSYSQAKLNAVARQLNTRPRKTLNYETPAQRFDQSVASIG
jgi:IS30 family transposase